MSTKQAVVGSSEGYWSHWSYLTQSWARSVHFGKYNIGENWNKVKKFVKQSSNPS